MKINNDVLSELMSLKAAVKPMLTRISEIEEACKEKGTFVTTEYAVVVTNCQRVGMASLEKCAEVVGKDRLLVLGLINTSTFKTVKVNKRQFAMNAASK